MSEATAKHTPGPWISSQFDQFSPVIVVAVSGEWVCKVSSEQKWAAQSEERENANARLIAAAPDILASIELFVQEHDHCDCYHGGQCWSCTFKDNIAKAKGVAE